MVSTVVLSFLSYLLETFNFFKTIPVYSPIFHEHFTVGIVPLLRGKNYNELIILKILGYSLSASLGFSKFNF